MDEKEYWWLANLFEDWGQSDTQTDLASKSSPKRWIPIFFVIVSASAIIIAVISVINVLTQK